MFGDIYMFIDPDFAIRNHEVVFVCEESGQGNNYPTDKEGLEKRFIRVWLRDSVGGQSQQIEKEFFYNNYRKI